MIEVRCCQWAPEAPRCPKENDRPYGLYGFCLHSQLSLPFGSAEDTASCLGKIEIREGTASLCPEDSQEQESQGGWYLRHQMADGSWYLRWQGLFEFRITADGRQIIGRPLHTSTWEAFYTYLLGSVLSFALIKQGFEPLHATVVVHDGAAVAFLGNCGYGKSSLAAVFIRNGWQLLTDDLLLVKECEKVFLAFPGPPRIKLFPEIARILLGEGVGGIPMHNLTPKLIIPLDDQHYCRTPIPLKAIYVLAPPGRNSKGFRVTKRKLEKRKGMLTLITHTFNTRIKDPQRLMRQFAFASDLVNRLPIKSLSYPRSLSRLPEVVAAIRKDVGL